MLLAMWPTVWAAASGAMGGMLNATLTADLRLRWSHVATATGRPPRRLGRLGLLANMVVGAAAAVAVHLALGSTLCCTTPPPLDRSTLPLIAAGAFIGLAASRWMTNEVDKRLLRAAVCKASAAPAAHPDTVTLLASASPHIVYATADDLMPRHPLRRDDGPN